MIAGAADAGVTPDLLWGFLPKPVAVALAIALALTYVATEITGKLKGPINWWIGHRSKKAEQRAVGWRTRDDKVADLAGENEWLKGRVASLGEEVRIVHTMLDAYLRVVRAHTDWDNDWVPLARAAGIDVPDPPSLYLDLEPPS